MSQFEQHLKAAQQRQQRFYLAALAGGLAVITFIVAIVLVTRATRIEILPQQAQQTAQLQVSDGLAFIIGNTLYALSGKPAVSVAAEGFYPRQQALSEADFARVMTITLKPLPAKLYLRSVLQDDKTRWSIDNGFSVQANELVRELEAGDYRIRVVHPYHQALDLEFSLARGEHVERTISLQPIEGELRLKTQPAGASLSIDNKKLGATPVSLSLSGGQYQIQLTRQGYETLSETIEITREQRLVERDYRLAAQKAQVQLSLNPAGGELFLNRLQVTPADSLRLAVNQAHTLMYSKPGYFTQSKTFRLDPDTVTTINFTLEKETGKVELRATPTAAVSINDQAVGTTPLTVTLAALPQKIVFSKAGYRSVTKNLVPDSKSVKKVHARLLPEPVASIQEAASLYQHKAGGSMRLYRPNETFTLGAERSEAGQRANEFVRQVRLTRPFYAGVKEVSYAIYQQFDPAKQGQAAMPVTNLSWLDAAGFCNWLSGQEGLQPVYQIFNGRLKRINPAANGYRLLTEAEWEWLARKANRAERTRFTWGDETVIPKNSANIADTSAQGTVNHYVPRYNDGQAGMAATGSYLPERSGLYDQGGNVSEWVHDPYSLTPPTGQVITTDPFAITLSDNRVVKGANWRSGTLTELRASYREGLTGKREDVGFRIGRYVNGDN